MNHVQGQTRFTGFFRRHSCGVADPNEDVTITNNEITNNLGAGIGADPGTTGTNFQITGNKIYKNGTNLYGLSGTGIQELGDCFTP